MNQVTSLKDLLIVSDGPPEAVWQSALQAALNSVDQPAEEIQPSTGPEGVVSAESTVAAGNVPETDDGLSSAVEEVAADDGTSPGADGMSGLSGDAGEGYDD